MSRPSYVVAFEDIGINDIASVGGKNASLGEMVGHLSGLGISVPEGIALTSHAYQVFLSENKLDKKIQDLLYGLDTDDISTLQTIGHTIRQLVMQAKFPDDVLSSLKTAFDDLQNRTGKTMSFAVRSSATAEDLPTASFAGQQESVLNVTGFTNILQATKEVYASLFNDRAIAYRQHQGFSHEQVLISVGIQRMVRSDLGSSGVTFTLDTESGFREVVFITSAYGLGEAVVQGSVNPDEFYISKKSLIDGKHAIINKLLGSKLEKMIYAKPDSGATTEMTLVSKQDQYEFSLSEEDVHQLAQMALKIEEHYGRPMDIEWAKDGEDNQLYILQARPETVASRNHAEQTIKKFQLDSISDVIIEGRSIGNKIGSGQVRIIEKIEDMGMFQPGEVLVADMTDPDWEPVMKLAGAIITNRGGRTCHAAIIARELGIPAVVGCGDATRVIKNSQEVTVSCASGDVGTVYQGILPFHYREQAVKDVPEVPVKIMINIANPERAFSCQSQPNSGVGLARLEFIISNVVGIHPAAALGYKNLPGELREKIRDKIRGYHDPVEFYVHKISESIATIATAFYPKPVILRLSDFKSNEYAHLLGGQLFEPLEENPMLGFRGASRYVSEKFKACFDLECQAIRRVRELMGLDNLQIMVPFVRTLSEAQAVIELLADKGLKRGENGLKIIMMCEIPSNALLADEFLEYFDGFSIGSNDLTQLTLGVDRDSELVADSFDERDPAVKVLLANVIATCKKRGKYVGICGQGPSDYLDFAKWLVEQGIDSISLNPDTVMSTTLALAGHKS